MRDWALHLLRQLLTRQSYRRYDRIGRTHNRAKTSITKTVPAITGFQILRGPAVLGPVKTCDRLLAVQVCAKYDVRIISISIRRQIELVPDGGSNIEFFFVRSHDPNSHFVDPPSGITFNQACFLKRNQLPDIVSSVLRPWSENTLVFVRYHDSTCTRISGQHFF